MFHRVTIRDNSTGDVLAAYDATSTSAALARYVRESGLDPNATPDSIEAAAGLADCRCPADHSAEQVAFSRRNPITNAEEIGVFATVTQEG